MFNHFSSVIFRKLNIAVGFVLTATLVLGVGGATFALANSTSNFAQTIGAGTLSVDIVDATLATVASPGVTMGAKTFSFACQTATGNFGTATEQLYVSNPNAANNGWVVSLAASATTTLWASSGTDFDFNDAGGSGCTDSDGDTFGGQMTVDPSVGTLAKGGCAACGIGNISKGSSASFVADSVDSITILTGAAASDDIGDWTLQGVSISQTIPPEQPAASDYNLDLTLSIVAS